MHLQLVRGSRALKFSRPQKNHFPPVTIIAVFDHSGGQATVLIQKVVDLATAKKRITKTVTGNTTMADQVNGPW